MTLFRPLAVALSLSASAALGQQFALNAGVLEVVSLPSPAHLGVYPYAGVSVALPLGPLGIIPGLAVEYSPDAQRWGGVATLTVDLPINPTLGLDVNGAFIHDQAGLDLALASYFVGGGVGCSLVFGKLTVSPFVNAFLLLGGSAWSLVPGLNLAYAL